MNIQELLNYCQICNSKTISKHNKIFTVYCCSNVNCVCHRKNYAAIEDNEVIYINDRSNDNRYTIYIEKDVCKYYLLLNNKEIYFDSIDSLIEGYLNFKKNKIFY